MRLRPAVDSALSSQWSCYNDTHHQFRKVYRAGDRLEYLLKEVASGELDPSQPADAIRVKDAIDRWRDV